MQPTISPKLLVVLLPLITGAQSQLNPSQSDAVASKVSTYITHVTAGSQYSSVAAVVSTAVPTKWQTSLLNGDISKVTTKSWYSNLPSDVQGFASSVHNGVESIIANVAGANASATTPGGSSSTSGASTAASTTSAPTASSSTATKSPKTSSAAAVTTSSSSSKTSSAPASATKNGAVETGAARMIGVGFGVAGAIGAMML